MYKILVVDDERSIQDLLKRCLEDDGYLVITTDKGQTALNWMKEVRLDLAIVDLGLPDMSGMDVCRAIKDDPKTRITPIVILTGNSTNEARIEGNEDAGAELFLNKPISTEDLRKAVKVIFEKAEKKRILLRTSLKTRLEP